MQPVLLSYKPAGFWRRIAALIYDSFISIALLFLATLIVIPFAPAGGFTVEHHWFQSYLFLSLFLFYAWCWKYRKQTIGMLAWKMKIISDRPDLTLTWMQCAIRFVIGIISFLCSGLGFTYLFFNKNKLTLYDKCSQTRLVVIDK